MHLAKLTRGVLGSPSQRTRGWRSHLLCFAHGLGSRAVSTKSEALKQQITEGTAANGAKRTSINVPGINILAGCGRAIPQLSAAKVSKSSFRPKTAERLPSDISTLQSKGHFNLVATDTEAPSLLKGQFTCRGRSRQVRACTGVTCFQPYARGDGR